MGTVSLHWLQGTFPAFLIHYGGMGTVAGRAGIALQGGFLIHYGGMGTPDIFGDREHSVWLEG